MARDAIGADTNGCRSSNIIFRIFFSESESDTDSIRYLFLQSVFAPQAFSRSVGRKLSVSFAPLHKILDIRGAIKTSTERLIVVMSKEEHSIFSVYPDATIRLSVILFLSEITVSFLIPPDIRTHKDGYHSSRILILNFCSKSESDTDNVGCPFIPSVFIPQAFGQSIGWEVSAPFAPLLMAYAGAETLEPLVCL